MTGSWGQDWASYQDYTPSTAGLAFVFVKQTEGLSYTNPKAASQVATARSGGLVVGHYHYPHMANNPATECDRFLAVTKPRPGDVLCLDWEGYDAANKGVSWTRQVAYKAAFVGRLRAVQPEHQHVVYCNTDYLGRDPKGEYGDGLWIATAGRPAGQPGISHSWLIHQYGASGVDRDYCPLTPAELLGWSHAKENDMTPDQAKQLADLHDALVPYAGWGYRNADQDAASVKGGHGHIPDAYGYLTSTSAAVRALTAQVAALTATVGALAKGGGLTAEQITAAAKAGADEALAQLGHALDGTQP